MTGVVVRLYLLLLIVTVSGVCNGDAVSRTVGNTNMENTEFSDSPKLDVQIEQAGNALTVEYRIKNTTGTPIYVFNVLWEHDNQGKVLPASQKFYASFVESNLLRLSKRIPPLPRSKRVELQRIPFATRIEPGEEFKEKISLPIPVEEYNPYFGKNPNSKEEQRTAESVQFTVQFVRASDELKIVQAPIENAFAVTHTNILQMAEELSSPPRPIEIPVKVRLDSFERF